MGKSAAVRPVTGPIKTRKEKSQQHLVDSATTSVRRNNNNGKSQQHLVDSATTSVRRNNNGKSKNADQSPNIINTGLHHIINEALNYEKVANGWAGLGSIAVHPSTVAPPPRKIDDASLSAMFPDIPQRLLGDGRISEDEIQHPENELYTFFLTFKNASDHQLYRKHMKKQVHGPLFPMVMFAACGISLHSWFASIMSSGPLFAIVAALNLLNIVNFSFLLLAQIAVFLRAPKNSGAGRFSDFVLYRLCYGEFDSITCVFAAAALGLMLLARVVAGSCTPGANADNINYHVAASWWTSNDATKQLPLLACNPEAAARAPPQDSVLLAFLVPAVFQVCIKGASRLSVFLCWCIGMAFLLASVIYIGDVEGNVWTLLYPSLFLLLAYEHERFKVSSFLTSKLALEHAIETERTKYEQEAMTVMAAREQEAKDREHEVLRSLIGNVAHDLKTPLQSVSMGLEGLKASITRLGFSNNHSASSSAAGGGPASTLAMLNSPKGELSMPLDEIVASMEASCSFMTMTINRAIDFTKASRSIELVPKMETFSLVEAVQAQVRCMNSLRSSPSSPLVVFEGDMEEICSCIISDKQWFMENLLCLLSNAVKYSDDDTRVKIKIQLEKFHPWQGALPVEPGRHSSYETGTPLSQMMVRNSSHPGGRFIGPAGVVGSSNIQPYPEMGARERDRDRDRDSIQEIALRRQSHNPSPAVSLPGSMVKNMSSPPPSSSLNSKSTRQSFILTDMLRITVEDTGIGLSDEAMKKLFRPFKQAQRFSGGTGLGLYSLSKRTEALGGKCGVTRRADGQQGCAFWFSVPYRPDKAYEDAMKAAQAAAMRTFSQAITPSLARQVANLHSIDSTVSMVDSQNSTPMSTLALLAAQDALSSSSEVKHRRVLVVDDSLTIMKMVSRTLEQHGFVVDTAKNGFVGLKKMMEANLSTDEPLVSEGSASSSSVKASRERERERERDTREKEKTKGKDKEKSKPLPYDLVLMDIQMPVMDGIEATSRFRQREAAAKSGDMAATGDADKNINQDVATLSPNHLLIIGMSANSDAESKQCARDAGMDYFIEKPFVMADFLKVLDACSADCSVSMMS